MRHKRPEQTYRTDVAQSIEPTWRRDTINHCTLSQVLAMTECQFEFAVWRASGACAPLGRQGVCPYACKIFRSTSAEFFEPNPTQLQIAFSTFALRPALGI